VKQYCNKPISEKLVKYVKKQMEDYNMDLAKSIVDDFNYYNKVRSKSNLPKRKKLVVPEYKKISEKVFNEPKVVIIDSTGEVNRNTVDLKADVEVV
jgi:hypothetical protein